MEEIKTLIVEHREIGKNTDSLEIGTPAKGGTIKVYGDFKNKEEFQDKIDKAIKLREYANLKLNP
jgi:hypothetical protein